MEESKTAEPAKNPLQDTPTAVLVEELKRRNDLKPEHIAALHSLEAAPVRKIQDVIGKKLPEEQNQTLAEKFASAVVRRSVFARLPVGSKINGVRINGSNAVGFWNHGPDEKSSFWYIPPEQTIIGESEIPDLISSHIVRVTPSQVNKGNMILRIFFFQDMQIEDNRGHYTPANVMAEMPNEAMTEFLDEISKNPDLLEDFYQKAFVGLDSKGGSPGMRRVKANGFYIISGDKLLEADKIGSFDKHNDIVGARPFFASLEKHQYQHGPYGTGEAFAPPLNS